MACPKENSGERSARCSNRPELAGDARFSDFAGRDRHRDEFLPLLEEAFLERATDEWLQALREAGIPNGRVNLVTDALEDPQAIARDAVVGFDHPRLGRVRELATPLRVGEERRPAGAAPQRGEHTDEVLTDLCGYSHERIERLRDDAAFGPAAGASTQANPGGSIGP